MHLATSSRAHALRRTSRLTAATALVGYMLLTPHVTGFGTYENHEYLEYDEVEVWDHHVAGDRGPEDADYYVPPTEHVSATAPATAPTAAPPSTAPEFLDTHDTPRRGITDTEVPENENEKDEEDSRKKLIPDDDDYAVTETSANPRVFFYRTDYSYADRSALPRTLLLSLVAMAALT